LLGNHLASQSSPSLAPTPSRTDRYASYGSRIVTGIGAEAWMRRSRRNLEKGISPVPLWYHPTRRVLPFQLSLAGRVVWSRKRLPPRETLPTIWREGIRKGAPVTKLVAMPMGTYPDRDIGPFLK